MARRFSIAPRREVATLKRMTPCRSSAPWRARFLNAFLTLIALSAWTHLGIAAQPERPNILWIVAEDINPHLGCYGDTNAVTPNIDRLAQRSLRYANCWSTAPVCAPARTALISGMYPGSIGGEHMRSGIRIPAGLRLYPQLLADAGYYCVNKSKEDYNIVGQGKIWAESSPRAHYRNRDPGQPFFAAFNIETTHESKIRSKPHTLKHDPARIRLPAYHPDLPEVRRDWAQYYDNITEMDAIVGRHLRELDELHLAEDTIVFFYGDNGSGMPRSKRWACNSGLHVPLIIHVPEKWKSMRPQDYAPGGVSKRLVSFVDFAPTLLSLAGRPRPNGMQGRAFLGGIIEPAPKYLFGLRGRMDERYDFIRSARNERFVYVRNYMPHLIYGQYLEYMFETPTTRVWKGRYDAGALKPPQTAFWERKPPEELYDLEQDPDEVQNLAGHPAHAATLATLRQALRDHTLSVRDAGFLSEAEMHHRAQGRTIYEMAQDTTAYPLESILRMAELASGLAPEAVPQLKSGLSDPDSAVRYWAAMGFLMRGESASAESRELLRKALADASPSVRIVAAEALVRFGTAEDATSGLGVLKALLSPVENGVYVSMMVLNSVSNLGDKADSLKPYIRQMPVKDPKGAPRANTFLERLVTQLSKSEPGGSPTSKK